MASKSTTKGRARPSVDAGFDVEQVPQPGGYPVVADQRGGEHRVGGGQRRAEEQRFGPVQSGDVAGDLGGQ
jgi:hypothetical protein